MTYLNINKDNMNHIVPSNITAKQVSTSEIQAFLDMEDTPIFHNGELTWNDVFDEFTDPQ